MKSTIQRVPDAEDGEIISSPELDAADIAIKIHEEVSSSEDSDVEETTPAIGKIIILDNRRKSN